MKLELWYPAKPYKITQGFGIFNPAYQQFGFTKHNGIDFSLEPDSLVHAMCDGVVVEVGYNSGAGNYVKYRTNDPVEVAGHVSYVQFMYMHGKQHLVEEGQKLKIGDALMVADNTGFSTGAHTHISAYFVNENGAHQPIGDPESDYCIDHSKLFTGYYAVDAQSVLGIMQSLILKLKELKDKLKI